MKMPFVLPSGDFSGVLLSADARGILRISLLQGEAESILHETEDEFDLLALFNHVARKLAVPRFIEPEPGERLCLDQCLGALVCGRKPIMRRRGQIAFMRRPRFLVRRRLGERKLMKKIAPQRKLT